MKTMLKVTLVVALFAVANAVFAGGNLKVNLVPVSGEKALLAISSLSNSTVQITLTDENQRVIYYSETTGAAENYRKLFNLADLEPGTYKITAVCDNLTAERTFEKNRKGIKIGKEITELEPVFTCKDDLLRCSYLNFQEDNVSLAVYDHEHLIYKNEMGRLFNVSQLLNLSKLSSGTYEAVLTSGDNVYSYIVRK